MNASEKSVILARGVYYRALYMNLAETDRTPIAEVIRAQWNNWLNDYTDPAWYRKVCEIQVGLVDWIVADWSTVPEVRTL